MTGATRTNMTSTVTTTAATAIANHGVAVHDGPAHAPAISSVVEVVTTRGFVTVAAIPTIEGVMAALRALRAAGATEDVVGFAIPLQDNPNEAGFLPRGPVVRPKRFNATDWLLDVIDPHRPQYESAPLVVGNGRNSEAARVVLGRLSRWLVGVQPFAVPTSAGPVWVMGRPNHAAAMQGVHGDTLGGTAGALATVGVPVNLADRYATRLEAGDTILTTCETDEGRRRRDRKIVERAGAETIDLPEPTELRYGVRPA